MTVQHVTNRLRTMRDAPMESRAVWVVLLLLAAYLLGAASAWASRVSSPMVLFLFTVPGVLVLLAMCVAFVRRPRHAWKSAALGVTAHVVAGCIVLMALPSMRDPISAPGEVLGLLAFAPMWPTFVLLEWACELPLYPCIAFH